MSLFKRKKQVPALYYLLDNAKECAIKKGEKSFFYMMYDADLPLARKWCEQNHIRFEVDHLTDGNVFYKFYL